MSTINFASPSVLKELSGPKFDAYQFLREKSDEILRSLESMENRPLAADLSEDQKFAIFFRAGVLKFDFPTGKMVSIHSVGIADDGRGGYIIGVDKSR